MPKSTWIIPSILSALLVLGVLGWQVHQRGTELAAAQAALEEARKAAELTAAQAAALKADLEEKVKISGTTLTVIYLYVIPARVSGEWNLNLALPGTQPKPLTVRFEQRPDSLTGSVDVAGGRLPLKDLRVSGEEIAFSYTAGGSGQIGRAHV